VLLAFASENEAPVRLLGEAEERPPKPGEVIYKDDLGTLCRRWNWKEADRTKLTAATRDGFLVIEGLPPVGRPEIEAAAGELAELVRRHCGGTVSAGFVDAAHPELRLR
jgi:DNA/RNA-binding domain of Phe-tRNA-synthetase-like protein